MSKLQLCRKMYIRGCYSTVQVLLEYCRAKMPSKTIKLNVSAFKKKQQQQHYKVMVINETLSIFLRISSSVSLLLNSGTLDLKHEVKSTHTK